VGEVAVGGPSRAGLGPRLEAESIADACLVEKFEGGWGGEGGEEAEELNRVRGE
jgi:hypothetical protein